MIPSKPARRSRTVWFNGLTVVSVILAAVAVGVGDLPISDNAQVITLFVISVLQPVVNVLLRLGTHEPISGTPGEAKALGIR